MARKAHPPTTKPQTYGYVRLSQTGDDSIEDQRARIEAYAFATGREPVAHIFDDNGFTGANMDRPQWLELRALIEAGAVSALIVTKLDRLSRNLADVLDVLKLCEKHDVALISVGETLDTSNATGRLLVHILASFGQFERERITERTRDSMRYKREQGKVYTRIAPFGFQRDGSRYMQDAEEQATIATMRSMMEAGQSFGAIATALNEDHRTTRTGVEWSRQLVRKVMNSKSAKPPK